MSNLYEHEDGFGRKYYNHNRYSDEEQVAGWIGLITYAMPLAGALVMWLMTDMPTLGTSDGVTWSWVFLVLGGAFAHFFTRSVYNTHKKAIIAGVVALVLYLIIEILNDFKGFCFLSFLQAVILASIIATTNFSIRDLFK